MGCQVPPLFGKKLHPFPVFVPGPVFVGKGSSEFFVLRALRIRDMRLKFCDIRAGIIRNVSVGYRVHRFEIERRDGEVDLWRAVDWEPMEILMLVPAVMHKCNA